MPPPWTALAQDLAILASLAVVLLLLVVAAAACHLIRALPDAQKGVTLAPSEECRLWFAVRRGEAPSLLASTPPAPL
jgi:hypothetical protein